MHDSCVDTQYIFPYQPCKKQLYRPNKEYPDQNRRRSHRELIPPEQLGNKIKYRHQHRKRRKDKSRYRRDTEPYLRIGGKAQHRGIIERVPIIMRMSCPALRLRIGNVLALRAELSDDAAQKRDGIVEVAQGIDETFIVESCPGEMLDLLDGGHLADELIVAGSQEPHDFVLFALRLDGRNDFISLFPFRDKARNQVDGILEITAHGDGTVSARLAHAIERRVELTEVLGVEYRLDFFVLCAEYFEFIPGSIRRAVVDKHQLIVVLRQFLFHFMNDCLTHGDDILHFIEAGYHDTDQFLCQGDSPNEMSRIYSAGSSAVP